MKMGVLLVNGCNWVRYRKMIPSSTIQMAPFAVIRKWASRARNCGAVAATVSDEYWILDWSFSDDSGEHERFCSESDGPGWMSRQLPLRDELLRGDTRALYLGWMARVCNGELAEDKLEPPLPHGLQTLSPAQQALAEFLQIDPDWLAAAAEASSPKTDANRREDDADQNDWLDTLSRTQCVKRCVRS